MVERERSEGKAAVVEEQIRAYLQTLKEDPRSRVFAPLARLLLECGYAEQAEKICRRGVEQHQDFSEGLLLLAQILLARSQPQQAAELAARVLELDSQNTEAMLLLAGAKKAQGDSEGAVALCMQVLDMQPQNRQAQTLLRELSLIPGNPRQMVATSPFRRKEKVSGLSPLSLFGEELQQVSQEAMARVSDQEQPFAALSSGSYPQAEGFEVPTQKGLSPAEISRVRAGAEPQPQAAVAPSASPASWMNPAYIQEVIDREGAGRQLKVEAKLAVPRNRSFLIWWVMALLCCLLAWKFRSYLFPPPAVTLQVPSSVAEPSTTEPPMRVESSVDVAPEAPAGEPAPERVEPAPVQPAEEKTMEKPKTEKIKRVKKPAPRRGASKRRRQP